MWHKVTCFLLFTLLLNFLSLAQKLEDFDLLYVLDEYKYPRGRTYTITDDRPSYFKLRKGKVTIAVRDRGEFFAHSGKAEDFTVKTTKKGDQVLTFYVLNSLMAKGRSLNFEVTLHTNGTITIHHFHRLVYDHGTVSYYDKKFDRYYFGHAASKSEIQEIKDYWDNQRR